MEHFARHLTEPQKMFLTEGALWKKSRSIFNPGFSLPHLMTLAPTKVDDALICRRIIGEHADSGEVRPIEKAVAYLTIDIVRHVVLAIDFKSQTEKNKFVEAFRSQISWTASAVSTDPFINLTALQPFMHRYYTRKMNAYLDKVLNDQSADSNLVNGLTFITGEQ
jgi:cytochrome P450